MPLAYFNRSDPKAAVHDRLMYLLSREDVHQSIRDVLKWFRFDHLRGAPYEASMECAKVACDMVDWFDGPELTVGLRDLLRAKDCFVRASLGG